MLSFKFDTEAKGKQELQQKFNRLMLELGLHNKFSRTYKLYIREKTSYGYFAQIFLNPGLSFDDLEKNKAIIQQNLNCLWIMEREQFQEYANVRIITTPIDKKILYEAPKELKPYEMYLGLDFSMNPIIIDANECCQFLTAGCTGSGKTRWLYTILLSWVLKCSSQEIELFIGDVAKNEYIHMSNVEHVKYYAETLERLFDMMKVVAKKMNSRKNTIAKTRAQGIATNIMEYNKIKRVTFMSYCYVIIDEFSIITIDKSDSGEEKEMKQYILDVLKDVVKLGRSYGIFLLVATQKASKTEIGESIFKNMATTRISFRANDLISSQVILEDASAVGLLPRYAAYSIGGFKKDYLFVPAIDINRIKEMIKPHIRSKPTVVIKGKPIEQYNKEKRPILKKPEIKKEKYEIIDSSEMDNDDTFISVPVKGDGFIDY